MSKSRENRGGNHVALHRARVASGRGVARRHARRSRLPRRAQSEQPPKYGGTLEIGTVYVTLSALSWDSADWNWKLNHDTGAVYEQLFAADLTKSQRLRRQASVLCRRLAPVGRHPRRARRELGVEAKSAARRDQPAQGRDVSGQARRDGGARTGRRRRRVRLQPPRQEPEEDHRLFRSSRQGRGHRQAHGGLHLQELQRRMGLPLRLGLLLRHRAQGSRRRRRRQLEERQRHRPVPADRLRAGQFQHLRQEPDLLGQGEDQRRRVQAAARRQGRLSHHQGRGDLPHRAAHRQARHPREHPLVARSTS